MFLQVLDKTLQDVWSSTSRNNSSIHDNEKMIVIAMGYINNSNSSNILVIKDKEGASLKTEALHGADATAGALAHIPLLRPSNMKS